MCIGIEKNLANTTCTNCKADIATLRSIAPPSTKCSWPKLAIVDLFAGCGGLSLGLQRAAYEFGYAVDVRLALDSDPVATAVYGSSFPSGNIVCGSIEQFLDGQIGEPATKNESRLADEIGQLDFLLGGPPCQGHSNLNNHSRRDDPRNALYVRMARAAEILNPAVIIVENVATVTFDVRRAVHDTLDWLSELGYVLDDKVVDLSNLGVPQKRRRHVILAVRDSVVDPAQVLDVLQHPKCEHLPRNVRWAIEDLEDTESSTLFDSPSKPYARNQARIDWLVDNDEFDLPNDLRPPCHQTVNTYPAVYGRMEWDKPALTVTTGFNCIGQGRYIHPSRRRVITPHEAARLQMLPDFVNFSTVRARKHLAKLIGNAVPPSLSYEIATAVVPKLVAGSASELRSGKRPKIANHGD